MLEGGEQSMKMSRYSLEQVAIALRPVKKGTPIAKVHRCMGIAGRTFFQ